MILSELCPFPTLTLFMDKHKGGGIMFYRHISSYPKYRDWLTGDLHAQACVWIYFNIIKCINVIYMSRTFTADLISYKLIHMYILTLNKIVVDNIHLFYYILQRKIKFSISYESSAIGRGFIRNVKLYFSKKKKMSSVIVVISILRANILSFTIYLWIFYTVLIQ